MAGFERRTHETIDPELCGETRALAEGRATVELTTTARMAADPHGLVHGGFTFGLADHAAMLAVNEPTVVLVGAETRFLAPVAVGETITADAVLESSERRRRRVRVIVTKDGTPVFEGTFDCVVPDRHVLEPGA